MDEENATNNLMKLDKISFEKEINKRSADILGHLKLISEPQLWKMRTKVAKRLISFRAVIIAIRRNNYSSKPCNSPNYTPYGCNNCKHA